MARWKAFAAVENQMAAQQMWIADLEMSVVDA
jgi:hypothetical protein